MAHAAALSLAGRTGTDHRDLVAATRWTAAYLLGLRRSAPTRVQLVVPERRRLEPRRGIEVARSRGLVAADVQFVQHVPVVVPARLLRDLAPVCEQDALRAVAIDLIQRRLLALHVIEQSLDRWQAFPGRGLLRGIIADLAGAGRTDSPLEFGARYDLTGAGVPLDHGQVAVPLVGGGVLHVDLGIAAICFGIEVDSVAHHTSREDLTRDALRHNAIAEVADDWRVLRLTWDIRRHEWPRFVEQVRDVVAAQARRHLGVAWPRPTDLRSA